MLSARSDSSWRMLSVVLFSVLSVLLMSLLLSMLSLIMLVSVVLVLVLELELAGRAAPARINRSNAALIKASFSAKVRNRTEAQRACRSEEKRAAASRCRSKLRDVLSSLEVRRRTRAFGWGLWRRGWGCVVVLKCVLSMEEYGGLWSEEGGEGGYGREGGRLRWG